MERAVERKEGGGGKSLLLHPLALGCLLALVVNDHLLKGAGALPAVVTGKLSDVAGLAVAPLVWVELAALLRLPGAALRHAAVASSAVGLAFAAVKLSPGVNATYLVLSQALLGPLGFRAGALLDPTDLLALPALALPLWLGWAESRRRYKVSGT